MSIRSLAFRWAYIAAKGIDLEIERSSSEYELGRREFIRIALMSSAAMMGSSRGLKGEEARQAPTSYAALYELPPGAVQPEGWLRVYMEKQAAQLGSKLTQVSWPFTGAFWAGEESAESWWPWEQKAYWLDGATRLALVLQDQELMAQVRTSIDFTLAHADTDGYLGPRFFKEPKDPSCGRWPQNVFFRCLAALSDAENPQQRQASGAIAEDVQRNYLADKAAYGTPVRNVTNIEAMLWCFNRTGDSRLLALAEDTWRQYLKIAEDPEHGDMQPLRVYADAPINCHGVTYAEIMKLPVILYLHTGKEEYLRFAQAAMRRVTDHHMLIDGIPSSTEFYRTVTSLDSHETCDISDHTWSWGYMLMATGISSWADQIERACFNAAPGAIKDDWKSLQYFSCPNQFLATHNSDHNYPSAGGHQMAYQPNPGQTVACCAGNVHRIFPNYVIRMWMKNSDGGLVAVLYGPSKVTTTVGAENQKIEIVQTTDFPFNERIHLKINTAHSVAFPLSLRIPGWCTAPQLKVNGAATSAAMTDKGFVVIQRTFEPGDEIELTLPMKVAITRWPQNGMGIERGPLVYSLSIKEVWEARAEPRFTTPEFPGWEVTPASAWNYGIALDPSKLEGNVKVESRPGPVVDPWENPPTMLTVPLRKIEGWDLRSNPNDPNQKFTPPLPDVSTSKVSNTVEQIALVPYGSTHLRETIFPVVPI